MNNSENVTWNDLHGGARVPINDTDVDGAPFNLNGSDPAWTQGSINKAIYDTHIIGGGTYDEDDAEDSESLNLAFLTQLRYINNDMLYGYNADARNTIPGDFMSFRGYPTATLSQFLTIESKHTTREVLINGQEGSSGNFAVFKYVLNSTYKMPYNIDFTITLQINGNTINTDFIYRVEKGFNFITHYRNPNLDEEINGEEIQYWKPVDRGINISVNVEGLSGDLICTADNSIVFQAPYYGNLPLISSIVTEIEYNPVIIFPTTSLGVPSRGVSVDGSMDLTTISNYETRVEKCNELVTSELYPRLQRGSFIYIRNEDTLEVGTKLYLDPEGTIGCVRDADDIGAHFWAEGSYYSNTLASVFRITRFLMIDENSIITYFDEPGQGYLGEKCWVPNL